MAPSGTSSVKFYTKTPGILFLKYWSQGHKCRFWNMLTPRSVLCNMWFGGRANEGVFRYNGKSVINIKIKEPGSFPDSFRGRNWAWPVKRYFVTTKGSRPTNKFCNVVYPGFHHCVIPKNTERFSKCNVLRLLSLRRLVSWFKIQAFVILTD